MMLIAGTTDADPMKVVLEGLTCHKHAVPIGELQNIDQFADNASRPNDPHQLRHGFHGLGGIWRGQSRLLWPPTLHQVECLTA